MSRLLLDAKEHLSEAEIRSLIAEGSLIPQVTNPAPVNAHSEPASNAGAAEAGAGVVDLRAMFEAAAKQDDGPLPGPHYTLDAHDMMVLDAALSHYSDFLDEAEFMFKGWSQVPIQQRAETVTKLRRLFTAGFETIIKDCR